MTVRAKIIAYNGDPLYNASVQIVNGNGEYLGQGVKTDNLGKFAFTSDLINGNWIAVSYTGMQTALIDPDSITGADYKVIRLHPIEESEVEVTPGDNWLWLILALGIGGLLLTRKKKGNA